MIKRLISYTILLSLLFIAFSSVAFSDEILYGRYPALSPDGRTVAFTYRGDIWTVSSSGGEAERLTIHEAEDIRPQFSPDGESILFSSNRFNNFDLFLIPVEGGTAQQLTIHSGRDIGTGFFASGDSVLFTSNRDGWRDIYKTSTAGGTPILLTGYPYSQEYNGRITSDGKSLIYNSGSGLSRWWRRDLKASKNADIYIMDRTAEQFSSRRLTSNPTHEVWPILNETAGELYYVACRSEYGQIFKKPLAGGDEVALTNFPGDGVQWLNSNPQGTVLIFEQNFKIWILNPARSAGPREVAIQIQTDERENLINNKSVGNKVERFALSPDGKKIATVVHGEIFIIPAEEPEEGFRITHSSARESYPVWGKDSKTIYYASDRDGNYNIYSADASTGRETLLTNSPENELKPVVSPDGRYLAFYRGLNRIVRLNLDKGGEVDWVKGVFFDLGVEETVEYGWSPDSKWLTFTMAGATYETNIYAVNLDGEVINLSRSSGWNYRPRFSEDGKKVYYSSWSAGTNSTIKIDLDFEAEQFFESSFDSLFIEPVDDDKKDKKKNKKDKDSEKEIVEVVINPDRIEKRRGNAFELTGSSSYPVLTTDGEKYIFVSSLLGDPEIWSITTEDEPKLEQLTKSGKGKKSLQLSEDSKAVFYIEGGKIKRTEIKGGKTKSLSFSASIDINLSELNRQKFEETWRSLNSYFYDSDFHGTDWEAVRAKYSPVVDHIRSDIEFRNLIKEMLGELRASHLSIYSRDPGPGKNIITGYTGLIFDDREIEQNSSFKIKQVLSESPADKAGIKSGQYLIAIDDHQLDGTTNIYEYLSGRREHRLKLTVADKPGKKGDDLFIKPISSGVNGNLVYNDWVEQRRAIVDDLSGGKLGYLHIRSMSTRYLEQFKQELVAISEAKEGLIIDVRNNGGGNIAVHLLGIMVKTPYFLRNFRDFPTTSENKMRSKAVEKPMTLLINNYSASNSEIFAEGFRRLKLGKIIGEPTAGAVIGTSSYYLIDGTRIRRPSWGAFTVDMEDTDRTPRYPDITIENLPDDFINGRDPQLGKAVEELLKEL